MDACPLRNPDLRNERSDDGNVSLWVPRRKSFWINVMSKLFYLPPGRPVELDALGTFVYDRCDGHTPVRKMLELLVERHHLTRREAEVALTTYLKKLVERGIVGMIVRERGAGGESAKKRRSGKRSRRRR